VITWIFGSKIIFASIGDNSSSHFNTWDEVVLKQQQDLWVDYLGLKTMIGEDELALTRSIHIGT
jgi:hypothetical protein